MNRVTKYCRSTSEGSQAIEGITGTEKLLPLDGQTEIDKELRGPQQNHEERQASGEAPKKAGPRATASRWPVGETQRASNYLRTAGALPRLRGRGQQRRDAVNLVG